MQGPDVAAVAVWSVSRLGRSGRDLYDLIEEMQALGVAFVSAKEAIDTSTASGRAFFGILATLAQFERELTSDRIAANFQQAAAGGAMIGDVPFGYVRTAGEVTTDPKARARQAPVP
jgi:DNA invertase Pin-like site-specific DNA recombinase